MGKRHGLDFLVYLGPYVAMAGSQKLIVENRSCVPSLITS